MAAGASHAAATTASRRRRLRAGSPRRALRRASRHSALVLAQRLEGTSAAGTLARLWAWQLWRRTAGRPVVVRCADSSLLLAPRFSRAAAVIIGTGMTERDDALFVLDLLRSGDLFVDVGANIGFYSVLAARRGARVRAYEPAPEACEACAASIALNGLCQDIEVVRAACGASPGVARFTTGLDVNNHIVDEGDTGVEVQVRALDEELEGVRPPLTMLKVDAEGHDLDVLRGALGAVARLRPVIMVEIWTGGAGPLGLLAGLGYAPYSYDPSSRALAPLEPGSRQGGNMLLIAGSQLEAVRARVREARRPPLRAPSVKWLS